MRWLILLLAVLLPVSGIGWTAPAAPSPEEAFAAALRMFDGVPDDECRAGNNPLGKDCIVPTASAEGVARGIATFNLIAASRLHGASGVLGRTPSGEWEFLLITDSPVYQLLSLPGEMIVCAEGAGLNIRAAPSVEADVITALPDLTHVWVEEFVLTEPGLYAPRIAPRSGSGWYRLSAPVEGWAYSRFLSSTVPDPNTGAPSCALRDQIERAR